MKRNSRERIKTFAALSIIVATATACSSMQVEKEAISKVRRVAIVGSSVAGDKKVDRYKLVEKMNEAYLVGQAEKRIGSKMKWEFLPFDQVQGNKNYRVLLDEKRNQMFRTINPMKQYYRYRETPNGFSHFEISQMDQEERNQLIQSLGVDAIASLEVNLSVVQRDKLVIGSIGMGSYRPEARMRFALWDSKHSNPIWRDVGILKKAEHSDTQIGGITINGDSDKARESLAQAVESSFDELTLRLERELQKKEEI